MARVTRGAAVVAVTVALSLLASGCSSGFGAQGDYVVYASADELAAAAPLIIVGTVVSSEDRDVSSADRIDVNDPRENPQAGTGQDPAESILEFTIVTVQVGRVVGGSASAEVSPGDTLEVERPRGSAWTLPGLSLAPPEAQLDVGETYALFLYTHDNAPASLTTATQSAYRLTSDEEFESVIADNPIAEAVARFLADSG